MEALTLNTGALMPAVGLGTWKSPPDKAGEAVKYALTEAGYRHVDCAWIYRNEAEIGSAFKEVFGSGRVKRKDIFVTGKLWNTFHARKSVVDGCKQSLSDLKVDYLDLYLMHWGLAIPMVDEVTMNSIGRNTEQLDPRGVLITEPIPVRETWEAMEDLVRTGLVKAIGVANFTAPMLIDLLSYAKIPPAVNQVELHPYLQQSDLVEFCRYRNIVSTGYSPLGSPGNYKEKGFPAIAEDEVIVNIARAHKKSPQQVLVRWGVQRGTVVIPKSVTPERIKENIDVFDFALTELEMQKIANLNRNLRFVNPSVWWKIPYFG